MKLKTIKFHKKNKKTVRIKNNKINFNKFLKNSIRLINNKINKIFINLKFKKQI